MPVWARTELIARVSLKGVGIRYHRGQTEDANADSVGGKSPHCRRKETASRLCIAEMIQ
ncbi:MAG: hypothetical protein ACLTER_24400 [Ruminococcus sp.]